MVNTIDTVMRTFLHGIETNGLTSMMLIITYLGSASTIILLTLFFILIIKNKKYGILIALNALLAVGLNLILKSIIRRPRPAFLSYIKESGYSFPSAHAMVGIAFYGFLIYLLWTKIKINKILRNVITLIVSLIVFMIGISRIYLGVHFATDVIGGFLIGFIYLILFIKFVYKNKIKGEERK